MRPRVLVPLSVVVLLTVSAPGPAQALDTQAVDRLVGDALKDWEVPGAAIAVVHGNRVYLKGYGVRRLGGREPVTPETVFPLASCTKAFTTTALAMLVDEGKLRWDDPVRKHVPYFRLADPLADANVTLRDLVTHRTGVGSHDLLWYRSPLSDEELVRRVAYLKPSASFRSAFQYQTIMFLAAGQAVAHASGQSWDQFVQERIFDPLGMKGASFTTVAALAAPDHATPHHRNRQGQVEAIEWYPFTHPNAAGSINASAADLGRWVRFQLEEGAFHGRRLVSAASLGETHAPQMIIRMEGMPKVENPETHQLTYGMGWVLQDYRGKHLLAHAGIIDGFRTHITLLPDEQIGIVILSNLHATRLNLAVSNSLVDLLLGLPRRDWTRFYQDIERQKEALARQRLQQREARRHKGTKPSRELAAYMGTYADPAYGAGRVRLQDGTLVWEWSSFRSRLEHFHFDTFTARNDLLDDPEVQFTLGPDGEVASLRAIGVEFKRVKK
jgi:CubicO group peptidase (beta-lactamase class C family)